MVRENLALIDYMQACAVIHSDDSIQVQRLDQEVAKAMSAGNRMGLEISSGRAIRWVTLNVAKSLGLDDQIGSLAPGKNADIVLWSQHPLSVYSLTRRYGSMAIYALIGAIPWCSRPTTLISVLLCQKRSDHETVVSSVQSLDAMDGR
jgi:imidazolonepropionase-like amidohydrolase